MSTISTRWYTRTPEVTGDSAPDLERLLKVDNWCHLPSTFVEVRRGGDVIRSGVVEAATADSTMLWLSRDGIEARTIIRKIDGYEVWAQPHQIKINH
jgi:hypothetical protein